MTDSTVHIAVLVGSLRKASINRELAQAAVDNAPAGVTLRIVEGLGALSFYNEDDDQGTVAEGVAALRDEVAAADAVLLVTPEYNGTLPAVLKNAIDWLSRPYGAGAMTGKPVGVIGAALGRYAGTWSRQDTRKSAGIAGGRIIEDVEVGIATATLGEHGVGDPAVVEQIVTAVERLVAEVAVAV